MVRLWALALVTVLLAACDSSASRPDLRLPDLPADEGPLPTEAVVWAIGDTIHVGDQRIQVERPVRRMVGASGRVYFTQGFSHTLWMTDGETAQRPGYETDELRASADRSVWQRRSSPVRWQRTSRPPPGSGSVRPKRHQTVLFPTGSSAGY